ncbi:hypothetical protein ABPG74_008069, partial [Tetrahymena malaccensis]
YSYLFYFIQTTKNTKFYKIRLEQFKLSKHTNLCLNMYFQQTQKQQKSIKDKNYLYQDQNWMHFYEIKKI